MPYCAQRRVGGLDHPRVAGQAQVVVAAEVDPLAAVGVARHRLRGPAGGDGVRAAPTVVPRRSAARRSPAAARRVAPSAAGGRDTGTPSARGEPGCRPACAARGAASTERCPLGSVSDRRHVDVAVPGARRARRRRRSGWRRPCRRRSRAWPRRTPRGRFDDGRPRRRRRRRPRRPRRARTASRVATIDWLASARASAGSASTARAELRRSRSRRGPSRGWPRRARRRPGAPSC